MTKIQVYKKFGKYFDKDFEMFRCNSSYVYGDGNFDCADCPWREVRRRCDTVAYKEFDKSEKLKEILE